MSGEKPVVSVCVPVYNGIQYLERFMQSFLMQTLKNIELVIVDNVSDDGTYERLLHYAKAYPGRVCPYRLDKHAPVPAVGRNEALRHAKGDYIYCCDSDDALLPNALSQLYQAARTHDTDVVVGNAYIIHAIDDGYRKRKIYGNTLQAGKLEAEHVFDAGVEFWRRLIHKRLFQKVGPIFEDVKVDDIAFIPVLMSYAENVWAIDSYLYYYFRRSDSTVGGVQRDTCLALVRSEKRALERANPQNCAGIELYVARRICINLDYRWQAQDVFIDELRELWPRMRENPLITDDSDIMQTLSGYLCLPEEKLPTIVYLNGFDRQYTAEELQAYRDKAFAGGCEVRVLNRESCDTALRPWMNDFIKQGKSRFVAHYFALTQICENGGLFLDSCIRLNECLNILLYQKGFVALMTDCLFSDYAFGGRAGDPFFRRVLETYENDLSQEKNGDVGERFRRLLWAEYHAPNVYGLDAFGEDEWRSYPVVILQPGYFTVAVPGVKNIAEIDESQLDPAQDNIEQIRLNRATAALQLAQWPLKNVISDLLNREPPRAERIWQRVKKTLPGRAMRKVFWVAKRIRDGVKARRAI